jgi:dTDP-4-dehydrorhamnose reductase
MCGPNGTPSSTNLHLHERGCGSSMNLFVFGLGFSARYFIGQYAGAFETISGTTRDRERQRAGLDQVDVLHFSPEGASPEIEERLGAADVVLVSVPPGTSMDPVLSRYGRRIAGVKRPQRILYLSTIGVYGDHGGEWVDETFPPTPGSERSMVRVQAERAWAAMARDRSKTVQVLRLSGIYGPGRNAFVNLAAGKARRLIKPGQVFNRIHVEDIARAIAALLVYEGGSEIWNVTDDEPAPPQDVIAYAAELMGVEPPPAQDFETAELTPMARSFYGENKRISNRKIREVLGLELAYPTYREGLAALWADGEGRFAPAVQL